MLKLIPFTIILVLFAAGSYAQTQFNQYYESLSQDDKKIVDSVQDNFLKNHIIFLDELSQANKFIGAEAKTDLELITQEDLPESHYNLGVETHKDEHLVLVILPVEKGSDGTYHSPTAVLGGKVFTFKVLYTVGIQGKIITVGCSKLSDNSVSRIEISPNQKVIKEIAEDLNGTISDNIITLP